jgi:hypothetical protein
MLQPCFFTIQFNTSCVSEGASYFHYSYQNHVHFFLGVFTKLRKATTTLVMSVSLSLSLCLHGKTRLQLDGFSWHLIFEDFFENLSKKFKFDYILKRMTCALHEYLCSFMIISRRILLRMRIVQKNLEKIKTHISYSIDVFRNSCRLWYNM